MITIDMGSNGRFGNQMFQYASLIGIATKQGFEFGIDYKLGNKLSWSEYPIDNDFNLITLDKAFNLSAPQVYDRKYPIVQQQEDEFHFHEKFFHTGDNIKLRGYFQTVKYFEHCQTTIRNEFNFRPDIITAAESFLKDKRNCETVSIHVRRGDYLKYPWHGVCDSSYYSSALSSHFADKAYNFIVITDDVEWSKSAFSGGDNFFVSDTKNQFVDMCIMSMCDHNIIANSSFGWWGSWLNKNKNKTVVAPSVWFREQLSTLNTKDLYLPTWKIV